MASTGKKFVELVSSEALTDFLNDNEGGCVLTFSATWCGPCKALAPKLDAIAGEYEGRARVVKVDIDQSRKTAMSYNVRSVPTLLLFKNGQVTGQLIGNVGKDKLASLVDDAL